MDCHAGDRGYEDSRDPQSSQSGDRHEEDGQRYVSSAGLRARGWTGGMVHRLLGAPDRLSVNPRLSAAPQVRLYRVERVETAERTDEFRRVAAFSARRSEAVRNAVRRRRLEVLERIRTEPIEVPRLDPGKLALRAVEHRARREAAAGCRIELADDDSAQDTGRVHRASLAPWKVDYLRHRMSHYDGLLDGLPGGERDSGRKEATELLRRRICAAIAEAYPPLEQECERQTRDQ
ncbi:hypothetical protein ACKI1I_09640 [Streptomyces turgidiscabies]|uniref:Uncharacterized protein n=1 Tax=Streptomyces turgidiscabies (strain Car8) TaxID=698760 RepID=L7ESN6_STRT8|nr:MULTISPECIES: hypothetical protein [Streptomyces]ELP61909.1 hypothetical protein STRTUCAR8_02849 [Streptomyces turgidiscabies Car8]MDX3497358.1 hypothetical protein [Streptomyces turgidiscabies]GAQ72351.1 hypothetical protein T45_04099 [Streptomyces turgidiscabies]